MFSTSMSPSDLEKTFESAPDQGFRNRAVGEYRNVRHWTRDHVDWESANILDFGCGNAIAAVCMAIRHPRATFTGVDITPLDEESLAKTFKQQLDLDIPRNFRFRLISEESMPALESFDLIYSWSVFEHIRETHIQRIFSDLKGRLSSNGLLFIQVDPLYFSPRGSHLYGIVPDPWAHLLLSIHELQGLVLPDATDASRLRLWNQFIELNRLTGQQIINYGKSAGLVLQREQFFVTDDKIDQRLLDVYDESVLRTFCFQALYC